VLKLHQLFHLPLVEKKLEREKLLAEKEKIKTKNQEKTKYVLPEAPI